MQKVYDVTNDIRDEFLIKILYKIGVKIGEALSLF